MARIGLLGGSFNPIHNGHIVVANYVRRAMNLDHVLLLPASNPPHKEADKILPFRLRYRLIRESLETMDGLKASDLDDTGDQPSYTFELIGRLHDQYPKDQFFFIIGADNVTQLSSWYRFRDLLQRVRFIVVTRDERQKNTDQWKEFDYLERLTFLPMPPVNVSSTQVRDKIRNHEDIAGLVPKPVLEWYRMQYSVGPHGKEAG